jgi:Ca2+-binding RTX toxin-like protein
VVSGSSAVLEGYETIFHQDLNGDGIIGVPISLQSGHVASAGAAPASTATIVASSTSQTLTGAGSDDTFVFNAAMGHATITNFQPASDVIEINHALFASVQALLAAAQNDNHGDVVITADAQDTITLQHVTLAQLQAHQSGFHIT